MPDLQEPVKSIRRRVTRTERAEMPRPDPEEQKAGLVEIRQKLEKEKFITGLRERMGLIMITCKETGVSYDKVSTWAKTDPDFAKELTLTKEYTLDTVEAHLFKQITEGNTAATIFYLKTKGKVRGFVSGIEVTGAGGGPIESQSTLQISEIKKELPSPIVDLVLDQVFARKRFVRPEKKIPLVLNATTEEVAIAVNAAVDAAVEEEIKDEAEIYGIGDTDEEEIEKAATAYERG